MARILPLKNDTLERAIERALAEAHVSGLLNRAYDSYHRTQAIIYDYDLDGEAKSERTNK